MTAHITEAQREDRARRRFGMLRSAVQAAPSAEAWGEVMHALQDAPGTWGEAVAREQIIPYADAALARWPDAMRVVPASVKRRLFGSAPARVPALPAMQVARTLHHQGVWNASMDDAALRLARCADASALRVVALRAASIQEETLREVLASPHLGAMRELDLRDASLDKLERFGEAVAASSLQTLRFTPFARSLQKLTTPKTLRDARLRELEVCEGAWRAEDLDTLLGGTLGAHIQALTLHNSWLASGQEQVRGDALSACLAAAPALKTLRLRRSLSSADLSMLRGLLQVAPLEKLVLMFEHGLPYHEDARAHDQALAALLDSPTARDVTTLGLEFKHKITEALARVAALPRLRELEVRRIEDQAEGALHALLVPDGLAQVEALTLWHLDASTARVVARALRAAALPRLRALRLHGQTHDVLDALGALEGAPWLPRLERLELHTGWWNAPAPRGMEPLLFHGRLERLHTLICDCPAMSPMLAQALAKNPALGQLQRTNTSLRAAWDQPTREALLRCAHLHPTLRHAIRSALPAAPTS